MNAGIAVLLALLGSILIIAGVRGTYVDVTLALTRHSNVPGKEPAATSGSFGDKALTIGGAGAGAGGKK
jgi:hypothetical protein